MASSITCWCGCDDLASFSPQYMRCRACGGLVCAERPAADITHVRDEDADLYGRRYWLEHLQQYGYPDLLSRCRSDLSERCTYWLSVLLSHKLPTRKTGLPQGEELGKRKQATSQFSAVSSSFQGRLLEVGCGHGGFVSLAGMAGFDATGLELSPWVVDFARKTFGIDARVGPLEEQGFLPGSFDVICMFDVLEHLGDPIRTIKHCRALLKEDGVLLIQTPQFRDEFEYDELVRRNGSFLQQLKSSEHFFLYTPLSVRMLLVRCGLAHTVFERAIFDHYDMFLAASASPVATHSQARIGTALQARPQGRIVQAMLDFELQVRGPAETSLRSAQEQAARLRELNSRQAESLLRHRQLLHSIAGTRLFRMMGKIGRWKYQRRMIRELADRQDETVTQGRGGAITGHFPPLPPRAAMAGRLIAVDLAAMMPGGDNGGAKLAVIHLIRHMSTLRPDWHFLLLANDALAAELADLARENVHWMPLASTGHTQRACCPLNWAVGKMLLPILRRLSPGRACRHKSASAGLLRKLGADMLFVPFARPSDFFDRDTPAVGVVYDIQSRQFPSFFPPANRLARQDEFEGVAAVCRRIICISDFVRSTLIDPHGPDLPPEKVKRIHIQLPARLVQPLPCETQAVLQKFALNDGEFLLYPANFWPHKNHAMLLTAFGMFHAAADAKARGMKLVCTGADCGRAEYLKAAAKLMGLADKVVFPGYVSDQEMAGLLSSSRAVVFPSLYEGFGMPVVEAMAWGKPVLCSNTTSLPETAGDAARYFNPHAPRDIAEAIAWLLRDTQAVADMVCRGYLRAAGAGTAAAMARQYMEVFDEVLGESRIANCESRDADLLRPESQIPHCESPTKTPLNPGVAIDSRLAIRDSRLSVCVVTPSFNQGRFIERTIRSVLEQGVEVDYVVMDGGSTDETLFVLRRYEDRLRWVSQKDGGQSNAVNLGINATSADIIGWLNSDDVYFGGAIRTALEVFEQHPDVDIVYGQGVLIDEDDRYVGPYGNEAWDIERLKAWCYFCQPATFIRRSAIAKYGPLEEHLHLCMDYEYWLRLGLAGARFHYVQKVLAGSRLHAQTKTQSQRYKASCEINDMLRRVAGRVEHFWLVNHAHAWAEQRFEPGSLAFRLGVRAKLIGASWRWNRGLPLGYLCRRLSTLSSSAAQGGGAE